MAMAPNQPPPPAPPPNSPPQIIGGAWTRLRTMRVVNPAYTPGPGAVLNGVKGVEHPGVREAVDKTKPPPSPPPQTKMRGEESQREGGGGKLEASCLEDSDGITRRIVGGKGCVLATLRSTTRGVF